MNTSPRTLALAGSILTVVLLVLGSNVRSSEAQPSVDEASDEALKEAGRLTGLGQEAHNAGEFDAAIDYFNKALTHAVDPELYYNLGQSYRLNQRPREALKFYLKYLEEEPNGRVAVLARQSVEITRKQIKKLDDKREGEREDKRDDESSAEKKPEPPSTKPPSDLPPSGSGGSLRLAGIVVGAAGLVGLGVSGYYANRSRSLSNELSEDRPSWSVADLEKFGQGEDAERRAIVAGVAGGVLLTGGIVLYVVGLDSTETKPMVAATGDRVEVMISGRF